MEFLFHNFLSVLNYHTPHVAVNRSSIGAESGSVLEIGNGNRLYSKQSTKII